LDADQILQKDRFLHCTKYLESHWGGVKIGRRFTQKLTEILTYHVVPGRLTTSELREKVKAGGGMAELNTVAGEKLTVKESGGNLWIVDAKGDVARITISNVMQSNGVIQVINKVMLPG
jgi:uncharacterized surface protein with fasciclin (FAS1) repeats